MRPVTPLPPPYSGNAGLRRVGVSEYPINDDELESALEWGDAEIYLPLRGDDTGGWDIPETTEDWKSLTQEDCASLRVERVHTPCSPISIYMKKRALCHFLLPSQA